MSKNIRKNYFVKTKKLLDEVDKAGELANHFRAIVLIGDQQQSEAYAWMHAPVEDLKNLILGAMRTDGGFVLAVARAFEEYYNEQEQSKKGENGENN